MKEEKSTRGAGVQVQIEHEHTASSADAATRVDASLARALGLCLKTSHIEPGQLELQACAARKRREAIKSQLCACACSVDRWRRFLDRVPQTDVRHARSTFSQHLKHEVHIERIAKSTVLVHVV